MSHFSLSVSRRRFLSASAALLGAAAVARGEEELVQLPTLNEDLNRSLNEAPLRMQFLGKTPAELASWQQKFAARLRSLIGPHDPPKEWSPQQLSTAALPDHRREEWLLKADRVPSLPLFVLRPKGREGERFPIVLALHGHGPFGHDAVVGIEATPQHTAAIRAANYDYGRQLVRQGYLVVAPCFTPFGRRITDAQRASKTDQCAVAFVRLMFLGQTLLGANLRDAIWALDYACQRDDARPDRVGCVGLSYGGRMTMVAAALDARIKAAVISGALNVFQERAQGGGYSCGAQVIPGLLEIGDTPEIGSLIAPRPCIWEIGSRDSLIDPGWAEKALERLNRAYNASPHPEHLQIDRFDGGHQWSGETACPMLAAHLKST
ncbi:MAG TPA: alpha/beta hydrolase family protein [Pirellulaceae bacterium]|nr:alpha/beta hydrolase family protein [Pirellulaceae bacterium]